MKLVAYVYKLNVILTFCTYILYLDLSYHFNHACSFISCITGLYWETLNFERNEQAKKQRSMAHSSIETKFRFVIITVAVLCWLRNMFKELSLRSLQPPVITWAPFIWLLTSVQKLIITLFGLLFVKDFFVLCISLIKINIQMHLQNH